MRVRQTVQVNPRIRTVRQLAELDQRDMQTMTADADVKFRAAEGRLFSTEGGSGSDGRWPALSPDYAEQKRRAFPGRKIMQRTGRLRRSLANKGGEHVAMYTVAPRATISLGTTDEVAAYHISGHGNPLHNPRLPNRDTLALSEADEQSMFAVINDYLAKKLARVERVLKAGEAAMRARRSA